MTFIYRHKCCITTEIERRHREQTERDRTETQIFIAGQVYRVLGVTAQRQSTETVLKHVLEPVVSYESMPLLL